MLAQAPLQTFQICEASELFVVSGKLLLVIPPVVRKVGGVHEVERDFSNNLRMYLANFRHVTFACPVQLFEKDSGILSSIPLSKMQDSARLSFVPLPYTYKELTHFRYYRATKELLRSEISKADYLIFSPHAKYDWATFAALQAITMGRRYDLESDWVHESVQRAQLAAMPLGLNKIRKILWMHSFVKAVNKCLSHSSLALLQGQDVFDAYKDVAPNPQKVLNVQVSSEDHISSAKLNEKVVRIRECKPLAVAYAGRMIPMKGPLDWLKVIHGAVEAGVDLHATWFGDGSLLPQMEREAENLGLRTKVNFAGVVEREKIMASLRATDVFLFCHKTAESPRCLGEALASGCSLVGYSSAYARELVQFDGGGEFGDVDNWRQLVTTIISLDQDRARLERLVRAAASSGKRLDRDTAMQNRINLIKKYLTT
jgi:colanic acid/amylovoran biosynthesis glycosyltransferase